MSIKSSSISRISAPTDISIFSETNCLNKTIFQRRIIANSNLFTYLINNVNVYYFFMIKCNLTFFQTASIKFYSCFSTIITRVWSEVLTELILSSKLLQISTNKCNYHYQHQNSFLNIFPLAEILNNFVYLPLQNDFCQQNNLNQMFLAFSIHFQQVNVLIYLR